jgi:hypothetical protein
VLNELRYNGLTNEMPERKVRWRGEIVDVN